MTVATTIMSAVGTGQLRIPPPTQEQAAAGNAKTAKVATIEPIRRSIPTFNLSRADFTSEMVTCSGWWASVSLPKTVQTGFEDL